METYTVYIFTRNEIIGDTVSYSYEYAIDQLAEIYASDVREVYDNELVEETLAVGITTSKKCTYPDDIFKIIKTRDNAYINVTIGDFYTQEGVDFCGTINLEDLRFGGGLVKSFQREVIYAWLCKN